MWSIQRSLLSQPKLTDLSCCSRLFPAHGRSCQRRVLQSSQSHDLSRRPHHVPRPCMHVCQQAVHGEGAAPVQPCNPPSPIPMEGGSQKLKIGIVGFGTFGQFLAKRFRARGHSVFATSRGNYKQLAQQFGVEFSTDNSILLDNDLDVVILASSIISTQDVLRQLPLDRFPPGTVFVDVLSVKEFPKRVLLSALPADAQILCTHPMFGPDSGKGSWSGLNFMYDKVRVQPGDGRCEALLQFFRDEGCRMVEMSCEEHDRQAASTQFVTHTVGRMVGAMQLGPTDISTKGFEALFNLVNNTKNDSFELYYGLFQYNQNALDELERLEEALRSVRRLLLECVHDMYRAQIFPMLEQSAQQRQQQQPVALPAAPDAASTPASNGCGAAAATSHAGASVATTCSSGQAVDATSTPRMRIGVVGFGPFGQFLAKRFRDRGHSVYATSRKNYDAQAQQLGVQFSNDPRILCDNNVDVVILASSIISTQDVLRQLPLERFGPGTVFVDVLSVKEFPKRLFLSALPADAQILCTHPMFGPDSGKGSWSGLNFMYDKVRVQPGDGRCEALLGFFRDEGCKMVEMDCEEHDRQAASTQFVTHTVGRILGAMNLVSTDINTKGFEALLNLVNNTTHDSLELYCGLFVYNQNATDVLERLEQGLRTVKKLLLDRVHDLARAQIFPEPMLSQSNQQQLASNVVPKAAAAPVSSGRGAPALTGR